MARASARRTFIIGLCGLWPLGSSGCATPAGTGEVAKPPPPVVVVPPAASQTPAPPPAQRIANDSPPPPNPPREYVPASEATIVQKPALVIPKPDLEPFVKAGCVLKGSALDCSKSAAVKAFGCQGDILRVDESLGGLTPKAAIAECNAMQQAVVAPGSPGAPQPPGAQAMLPTGIVMLGCMIPVVKRYLVSMRGKLTLVASAAELAALFAPVESPEEALGFAVALSHASPQYKVELQPDWRAAPRIETSYSEPAAGGFKVHLFEYQLCGCGPHGFRAVDFLVAKDGGFQIAGSQAAYTDPRRDHVCID